MHLFTLLALIILYYHSYIYIYVSHHHLYFLDILKKKEMSINIIFEVKFVYDDMFYKVPRSWLEFASVDISAENEISQVL